MNIEDIADRVITRLEKEVDEKNIIVAQQGERIKELEQKNVLGESCQWKQVCVTYPLFKFLIEELFPKERHEEIKKKFIKVIASDHALCFDTEEERKSYKEMVEWVEKDA